MKTLDRYFFLRLIITFQMIVGGFPSLGYSESIPQQVDISQQNIVNLSRSMSEALAKSPPLSVLFINKDGHRYMARYFGLYSLNSGSLCTELSSTCIPGWGTEINVGTVDSTSNGQFNIYTPDDPRWVPPSSNEVSVALSGPGGYVSSGISNQNQSAAEGTAENGSQKTQQESYGKSNLGQTAKEIGSHAVQSAIIAGASAGAVNYFAERQFNQSQANLSAAIEDYEHTLDDYQGQIVNTELEAMNLAQSIARASNISQQAINLEKYQSLQQREVVDISELNKNIKGFDPAYQKQITDISKKINVAPTNNKERMANLKLVGGAVVRASVQSRLAGWMDISDAQLETAKKIADILYGIDPFTAIHRGFWEVFTGKNIITGQDMSNFERGLSGFNAAVSLVSLGALPTIGKAVKMVSMIAESGIKTTISSVKEASLVVSEIADGIKASKLATKAEIEAVSNTLTEELKAGELTSITQVKGEIQEALSEGKIQKLEFKAEFQKNPASPESLKFIKKEIRDGSARVERIYPGTNDEIVIIGRSMGEPGVRPGVKTIREKLITEGYHADQVKIFDPLDDDILSDWADILKKYNYNKDPITGRVKIPDDILPATKMYQANEQFMKEIFANPKSRPTILDLVKSAGDTSFSKFYDELERGYIEASGIQPWK
ncbi:MAG: pre-toxin TG domain-containing protein [Pseudobdellovibrionaceae bacterium]